MVTIMNSGNDSMDMTEEVEGGMSGGSDDEDDCCPSSPGSGYEEGSDLITVAMSDEVTAQLAASGKYRLYKRFSL